MLSCRYTAYHMIYIHRYLKLKLMAMVSQFRLSTWKPSVLAFFWPVPTLYPRSTTNLVHRIMATVRTHPRERHFRKNPRQLCYRGGEHHSPSFKELSHTKWDPWVRLFFLSDRVALCIEGAVFPWRRQGATGTYPGSGSALWVDCSGRAGEITLIGCVGYCSPLELKDFFCGDFI